MHDLWRTDDVASVDLTDALVAETDTKDRDLSAELGDDLGRNTSIFGATGSGADQDSVRGQIDDLLDRQSVTSVDGWLGPHLAEVLDEVEDKRVVIVENKNSCSHRTPTLSLRPQRLFTALLIGIGEPGSYWTATITAEMANEKRSSKKTGGGRVTPKKSARTDASQGTEPGSPGASTRYTPPAPRSSAVSARWVPIVMLILFGLGLLIIFLHYVDLLIPGAASNWWLLGGLGCILAGIITATQYR